MSCLVLAAHPSTGLWLCPALCAPGNLHSPGAGKGGPWLQGLEGPGKLHATRNETAEAGPGAQRGHLQPGGRWGRGTQKDGLQLEIKPSVNPNPDCLALFPAVSGKPRVCEPKLLHLLQRRLTILCPKQAWLP